MLKIVVPQNFFYDAPYKARWPSSVTPVLDDDYWKDLCSQSFHLS